jgi:hypothetical protein
MLRWLATMSMLLCSIVLVICVSCCTDEALLAPHACLLTLVAFLAGCLLSMYIDPRTHISKHIYSGAAPHCYRTFEHAGLTMTPGSTAHSTTTLALLHHHTVCKKASPSLCCILIACDSSRSCGRNKLSMVASRLSASSWATKGAASRTAASSVSSASITCSEHDEGHDVLHNEQPSMISATGYDVSKRP